ncbi:cation:proton antiporter [Tropicibacter naphthalenivorans]|uniref:Potassium/proton antiporter n=1 Tax=Tropicibacter naphthalenivorans TaxID=441103 RepID=A0A0P1G642_9RHOB|nr:sodium:proton antiporter [Tropicibacter naphthalenivorans]CUH77219.1 potassium/proton antiporter [Tropicibacter naphthalenivorans]SMC59832.1 sodium/proton antiporter, CPA1 family [Tropicibacter naphthalenivorans]
MAVQGTTGLDPVLAFALVGALGVGSQWLAWRLRLPAIVLMLAAGLIVGPGLGVLDPGDQFGAMLQPMIAIAVAIILFEGGLTLNLRSLSDAAVGVRRLVVIGAPLGWLASASALHFVAGLSWEASAVFGGIMIVTGPTVIAPLLRQAKLSKRPAALLQWEAIVNDPVGALAAVLAFEVVVVLQTATGVGHAIQTLAIGILFAGAVGLAAGWALVKAFRGGYVPEYMKVPVLFVLLLAVFAITDSVLHESGLLAVTVMGLWIANAELPSFTELRRFKEQATVLLVSGVFILLAANMSMATLGTLDWRALAFVMAVVLVARPLPVLIALWFSNISWKERALVAMTGPRGVVLVAVAGLFGERLVELGIEDADRIAPLAFALVAATVVLHGFTLTPLARALGLTAATKPGVLILGGSRWSVGLAEAFKKMELPVLIADPNHAHLRAAREAGIETFFGDILSEVAEHRLDAAAFEKMICATDNDAYNTLVATDIAPEFGRENVYQVKRVRQTSSRHALPATLGGRKIGGDETYFEANARLAEGWEFRVTRLSEEFTLDDWRTQHPEAIPVADLGPNGTLRLLGPDETPKDATGTQIVSMTPARKERLEGQA